MESLTILQAWASAAWADGKLGAAEARALQRFIDASTDLSETERGEALRMLQIQPTFRAEDVHGLSVEAREGVYRAALQLVRMDGKESGGETVFLSRLVKALDLGEETLSRIEAEASLKRHG